MLILFIFYFILGFAAQALLNTKTQDLKARISITEFVRRNTDIASSLSINTSDNLKGLQYQQQDQQQHQNQGLITTITNMPEVLHTSSANSLNTTKYHHNSHQSLTPAAASAAAAAAIAMNTVRMSTISPTLSMNGSSNEATNSKLI